ncbi:GIN domain-containing protein [Muriicola sp. E247]|uniref:GIN domain-containing protein n=1 Tax=Muriicola sp. E247 TaxID=3242730 RepID=UPI0035236678
MKIILRSLILILICHSIGIQAQRKPKIKGNRDVVEVSESLPPFSAIELRDDLDIVLKRAPGEAYQITADDNLIDVLKFKVENGVLVVSSFYQITAKKELSIQISYVQLNQVTLLDGRISTAEGERINSEELVIQAEGLSRIKLDADAGQLSLNMQDNTRGNFTLTADSLSVQLKHKADATVYANAFTGKIYLKDNALLQIDGTSNNLELMSRDNAKIRAVDLAADRLSATLAGSSDTRIMALEHTELNLTEKARCYLFGDPEISLLTFKDSAELFKRNK